MGVWKSFCFLLTLFDTSKTINCTIFTPMCTDNAMDHLRCHEPSNFKCGYSTSLHALRSLITVWSNTGKPALSQPISSTKDWSCWSCPTGTCHLPAILWRFKWRVRTFAMATPNLGKWIVDLVGWRI